MFYASLHLIDQLLQMKRTTTWLDLGFVPKAEIY
jgi:hypothetical protein